MEIVKKKKGNGFALLLIRVYISNNSDHNLISYQHMLM